jgi:hypothetical protein
MIHTCSYLNLTDVSSNNGFSGRDKHIFNLKAEANNNIKTVNKSSKMCNVEIFANNNEN